jgi:pyruvate dehydrogenase E2 component (dihydrolipoamide acetyltransferase)
MSTFKLPDLGEGLAEAEILLWHVKPGDQVQVDQPMVSVETAKAVVEVPVPFSGRVTALHGVVGDIIATGARLIDLEPSTTTRGVPINGVDLRASTAARGAPINGIDFEPGTADTPPIEAKNLDAGTVVGTMPTPSEEDLLEPVVIGRARGANGSRPRAVPVARALANRLGLALDDMVGSGPDGVLTLADVIAHAGMNGASAAARPAAPAGTGVTPPSLPTPPGAASEPLRGARRAMAHSMSMSRDQVAGSTVCDDADIHAWDRRGDYVLRLIRAMIRACAVEPALNAWYDAAHNSRVLLRHIDLAIAVDTPSGLIVPVLRDIGNRTPEDLRAAIAAHKDAAHRRSMTPDDLRDFTLMLSNFGTLAGRYGIPLVVPPAVAILGAGKVRQDAVVVADAVVAHRRMPLSLSFDHRCITGGEACRFLAAVIADLEEPD